MPGAHAGREFNGTIWPPLLPVVRENVARRSRLWYTISNQQVISIGGMAHALSPVGAEGTWYWKLNLAEATTIRNRHAPCDDRREGVLGMTPRQRSVTHANRTNNLDDSRAGSKEKILAVAAELIARNGFSAVSVRDIASASGVGMSTVLYHVGSKQKLLQMIMEDSFSSQTGLMAAIDGLDAAAIENRDQLLAAVEGLMVALVEDNSRHPQTRRLWLRLLFDQPQTFAELEAVHSWPRFERVFRFFGDLRSRGILHLSDVQLRYFVASIDWILDGYSAGGVLDLDGQRRDPTDHAEIQNAVEFLQTFCRKWL